MNKIILIGNIGRIESQVTSGGINMTKFSLAVTKRRKDPETGQYGTDWFNCVAWRKTAEFLQNYCEKGTKVAIDGRIESRKYTGNDGVEKTVWDVTVEDVNKVSGPTASHSEDHGTPDEPADEKDPFSDD